MAMDLDELTDRVKNLSEEELIEFRQWFVEYDPKAWDEQFERDAESGALDQRADEALREHEEGKTTPL